MASRQHLHSGDSLQHPAVCEIQLFCTSLSMSPVTYATSCPLPQHQHPLRTRRLSWKRMKFLAQHMTLSTCSLPGKRQPASNSNSPSIFNYMWEEVRAEDTSVNNPSERKRSPPPRAGTGQGQGLQKTGLLNLQAGGSCR